MPVTSAGFRSTQVSAMRVLFFHQNFPGHFRALAPALAADGANTVVFATQERTRALPGVRKVNYGRSRDVKANTHPYLRATEEAVLTAQGAFRAGLRLREEGFEPDVVIAHSGWGPSLYVPDLFPKARFIGYFEWFYRPRGSNSDFLPESLRTVDEACRIRMRNSPILMDLAACDWGIVATEFQRQQFPAVFHPKLSLIPDGIDTGHFSPLAGTRCRLGDLDLSEVDEIVTYATRGLEPYRGFPTFFRAVARLLARRPATHVVIAGEDRAAYGSPPPGGGTWKDHLLAECDLPPEQASRVHFVGLLPPADMLTLLRASAAHVYATVPFIPSWSLFEAMAAGCVVVATATPPVTEVITDGETGLLYDFFDDAALADRLYEVLDNPHRWAPLRAAARDLVVANYDVADAVTRQVALINDVVSQGRPS